MPTNPPTIPAAPAATPQRGDRTTFSARVDPFVSWLISAITQIGAVASNCFSNATEAANSATAAASSASAATVNGAAQVTLAAAQAALATTNGAAQVMLATAQAEVAAERAAYVTSVANYKGPWESLTGALNIPATVSHVGLFWALNSNLANVTTATPGVSAAWTAVGQASSITDFTSSGTWAKPTWGKLFLVEIWAGGGGGSNYISAGYCHGANGGQYSSRLFRADELPASVSLLVGLGGNGGAVAGNNVGGDGGDTTFGAFLTARGGRRGTWGSTLNASYYPGFSESTSAIAVNTESYALYIEMQRSSYGVGGAPMNHQQGNGGNTLNGGAGGGSACASNRANPGGTSLHGGSGGAATINGTPAGAGGFPSGGGGSASNNGGGGKGGDGRIRITVLG